MTMRLRIHHGAVEIGGNCIELESAGTRLLLDLGMPLEGGKPTLPDVTGLAASGDPTLAAIVLSHPHLDHYGLVAAAHPSIPVWLGEAAIRLLAAAAPFSRGAELPEGIHGYLDQVPFEIGPFKLTPYLMDHSAFDAYGLLVEAGGKRVFYTGDFRGHGRKSDLFTRFLGDPPADIDVLLMEGTTLGRDDVCSTEVKLEDQLCDAMVTSSGLVLACFSGQNIDRFVTFLRASWRAGRTFVADAYLANLIDALQLDSMPDMADHDRIRVFLPKRQKAMIVRERRFDLIERYRKRRIFIEQVRKEPKRYTMVFRSSMVPDLDGGDWSGGSLIWSLWPGYLDRDRTDLRHWAAEAGLQFRIIHTSGHAHKADLRRMAEAIAPGRLVPIHTHHPDRYADLYPRIEAIPNGVWTEV